MMTLACIILSPLETQVPESSPTTAAATLPQSTAIPSPTKLPSPTLAQMPKIKVPPTLAQVPPTTAPLPSATPFPEKQLHVITNDAGSIAATIPTVWTDVRSLTWKNEKNVIIGHVLIASTDVDAFLRWEVEGVSISVTRNLGMGYLQLLESDYSKYRTLCNDPYFTFFDFENNLYRGKEFVLDTCAGVEDGWLSIIAVVPLVDSGAYVARVLAYDMIPLYGDDFRDIMMRFEVFPEKLP
jgi:hypothetical protein